MDVAMQRIMGLASEAERDAIHDDLDALELEIRALTIGARDARERGEKRDTIDVVDRRLRHAALRVAGLREDLLHAKTQAEQEASEELKKKVEGTLDHDVITLRGGGRLNAPNPPLQRPLLTP